jgi:uncharacterized membrane protein YcaP (DUF421 family)
MDTYELWMTAVRGVAVYAVMLVVIRCLGKRTVGNLSAFDLLVALMLGEVVDEIIYGDVSFSQGLVAIVPIAAVEYGNSWLSYLNHGLGKLLEGKPTILVKHGEFQRDGMRRERMNEYDIMSALRHHGIEDIRDVKLAIVEPDGQVSVIEEDWSAVAEKSDVNEDESKRRDRRLRGRDEPSANQSTTSHKALS